MDKETLYSHLPVSMQNAVTSLVGYRLKRRRYDVGFKRLFARVRAREPLNGIELRRYQEKRLKENLEFVRHASPFYEAYLKKHRIDLEKGYLIEQIAELPILRKQDVKEQVEAIHPKEKGKEAWISCHTSGTTGSGLVFYETKSSEQERWATWWRYRHWHGIGFDTWCGYFGGRSLVAMDQKKPPFWRINAPGKQWMFSAYHLNGETAVHYVKKLKQSKVPWIHGYPSVLSLLAGYILEQKLDPGNEIRIITTGAESLLEHQRQIIEEAFGVRVRQHYGQAESVANISECEFGKLHVDEDYSLVEFVPLEGNVYRIVGTGFINPVFFLLRYDTGDTVTLEEEQCPCGRPGRIVKSIDGRIEDYVVLPDGTKIGRLDHIFKDCVNIREAQIVQEVPERITIQVVKGANYTPADEARLLTESRKRLGNEVKLTVRYVDEIPKTRSGKLRLVVSKLQ